MLHKINDYIDLESIIVGDFVSTKENLNIKRLIPKVVEIYKFLGFARPVNTIFRFNFGSNIPEKIQGDKQRIEQILANFLCNAQQFNSSKCV